TVRAEVAQRNGGECLGPVRRRTGRWCPFVEENKDLLLSSKRAETDQPRMRQQKDQVRAPLSGCRLSGALEDVEELLSRCCGGVAGQSVHGGIARYRDVFR